MMPMLRFFRHGDGNFALFNGMGPTQTDLLTTILAYDDARGTPLANAPHSGYQRLEARGHAAADGHRPRAADAGEPGGACRLPVVRALDASLSRIVVNCGLPTTSRESWRQVARATAAHSTVTFNDTSSCRFIELEPGQAHAQRHADDRRPAQVIVGQREEQADGIVLRASHDGYADIFNVIHQRVLMLSADGQRLDGEDLFTPAKRRVGAGRTATSSRCASICIPRSRPTGWPTDTAPCC